MCDLNWCPVCDTAIAPDCQSLYCSEACLQADALNKNPLLGYDFSEFQGFLKSPSARYPLANIRMEKMLKTPVLSPTLTTDISPTMSWGLHTPQLESDMEEPLPIPGLDLGKNMCFYCDTQSKHPRLQNLADHPKPPSKDSSTHHHASASTFFDSSCIYLSAP